MNNYTQADIQICSEAVNNKKADYICFENEIGANGTPHLQGYLYKKNKQRFSALRKLLPRAHWSVCKGTQQQNIDYCSKDYRNNVPGCTFLAFGTISAQGRRTDLEKFRDEVVERKGQITGSQLRREFPNIAANYPQYAKALINDIQIENYEGPNIQLYEWEHQLMQVFHQEPVQRTIYWIWSPQSGTGKTIFMQYVAAQFKADYLVTKDLELRNILYPYEGQKIIHIDLARDMTDAQMKFIKSTIESLSDQGIKMSSKYECVQKIVKAHIVVTSNQPPMVNELPGRIIEYQVKKEWYQVINHINNYFS